MTYASPTKSLPQGDCLVITGTEGWLSVNVVNKPGTPTETFIRTVIKSVVKADGKPDDEEKEEEVIEKPRSGIVAQFASFFDAAISGKDDGLGFGDPFSALGDVAFIQAALNSNGELVDLTKLLQA